MALTPSLTAQFWGFQGLVLFLAYELLEEDRSDFLSDTLSSHLPHLPLGDSDIQGRHYLFMRLETLR